MFQRQDENVIVSFGLVENPSDQDTTVSLELAYALDPTTDESYSIEFVHPKIGGLPIDLPMDLKASVRSILEFSEKFANLDLQDFFFDSRVMIEVLKFMWKLTILGSITRFIFTGKLPWS